MKTITLLIVAFLVVVSPTHGQYKRIGQAIRNAMKSDAKVGGTESLTKFYTSLSPKQKDGAERLLKVMVGNKSLNGRNRLSDIRGGCRRTHRDYRC